MNQPNPGKRADLEKVSVAFSTPESFFSKSGKGLLRPNKFVLRIDFPDMLIKRLDPNFPSISNLTGLMQFNVSAVQVPNIGHDVGTLSLNTWKMYYLKERSEMDLSITFFESPELIMRRLFTHWMRMAYDPVTKIRGFFDEIKGNQIVVHPFLPNGIAAKYGDVFTDVLPFEVNDINYDVGVENTIHKTEVKFKYVIHDVVDAKTTRDLIEVYYTK